MVMCICRFEGSRRIPVMGCRGHHRPDVSGGIPGSDSDSAVHREPVPQPLGNVHPAPDDPDAAPSIKDVLLFRLHNALTGLENAAIEVRVARRLYDNFVSSALSTPADAVHGPLSTPADAVQSLSAEVGLSPSQTFSADSRAEGVSVMLPLGTGSQEGGAGERTNAAAPPSQSAPAKLKRPSRAVWP